MISYELALRLKKAGFPQGEGVYLDENGGGYYKHRHGTVFFPTLSELIEACGAEFGTLARHSTADWRWMWRADRWNNDEFCGRGETSEEAVARLWLALNEKNV